MTHAQDLLQLLHGAHSSLTIGFNEAHAPNHQTAQQWMHDGEYGGGFVEWVSAAERDKAIANNTVWTIQWYPDTPVGFFCVGASTFEAAAKFALTFK